MFKFHRFFTIMLVLLIGLVSIGCAPKLEPLPKALEGQEVIEKKMGEPIESGPRIIRVESFEYATGAGKINCFTNELYKIKQARDYVEWLVVTISVENPNEDRWIRVYRGDLKLAVMDEKGRWERIDDVVQSRNKCDSLPKMRIRATHKKPIIAAFRMRTRDMKESNKALYMDIAPTFELGDDHKKVKKTWVKVPLDESWSENL